MGPRSNSGARSPAQESKALDAKRKLTFAAALALLIGCASTPPTPQAMIDKGAAEMKSTIQRTVADPGRRGQLVAHADGIAGVLRAHAGDYAAFVGEYQRLNGTYDTPPERIEALFSGFEQRRQANRTKLLDLHFQMIALTSAPEWPPIAKAELEMLQSAFTIPASAKEPRR